MHWFYDPALTTESNSLPIDQAKHAGASLRIGTGEQIAITNGKGLVCQALIKEVTKSSLVYEIENSTTQKPSEIEIILIQALAKADRDELALQTAVELGASAVYPWESARSVVRWDEAKKKKGLSRWQQIAIEAMKQSQQSYLTKVPGMFSGKELLVGQVFVLDPTSKINLDEVNLEPKRPVYLIVGPEGGISEQELQYFDQQGYQRVRLGSSVLRTSTAGPAAIAVIRTLLRDW